MNTNFKRVTALLLVLGLVLTAMASAVEGTVKDASALKIRSETSTSSEVLGKYYSGETVDVQGKMGDWYIVNKDGVTAFVFSEYVDLGDIEVKNTMGTITGSTVNVRAGAGKENKVIGKLVEGTMVTVLGIENGWYKIKFVNLEGYVSADYLDLDGLVFTYVKTDSDGKVTETYTPRNAAPSDAEKSMRQKVVDYAMEYIGTPYVYAGSTPDGFDCSGFTQYVFKNFDIKLDRRARDQYKNNGSEITKDELLPGDLVFFTAGGAAVGHVGIYIGDDYFVHASSPGDVVRVTKLSSEYYVSHYVGCKRVIE